MMMTPRLVYTQQHSVTTGGKLLLIFVEINLYFFLTKCALILKQTKQIIYLKFILLVKHRYFCIYFVLCVILLYKKKLFHNIVKICNFIIQTCQSFFHLFFHDMAEMFLWK